MVSKLAVFCSTVSSDSSGLVDATLLLMFLACSSNCLAVQSFLQVQDRVLEQSGELHRHFRHGLGNGSGDGSSDGFLDALSLHLLGCYQLRNDGIFIIDGVLHLVHFLLYFRKYSIGAGVWVLSFFWHYGCCYVGIRNGTGIRFVQPTGFRVAEIVVNLDPLDSIFLSIFRARARGQAML